MERLFQLALLPAIGLMLSGCVAGMMASAVGMAAGGQERREPRNVELMLIAARQACTDHASQHGTVEITRLREGRGDQVIVSGTVTGANGRSAFDCSFVAEVTGFKLQPITAK